MSDLDETDAHDRGDYKSPTWLEDLPDRDPFAFYQHPAWMLALERQVAE